MKLISSIKNQTTSILAITALAVGFTPVLPGLANNLSDITGLNISDITGPNVSDITGTNVSGNTATLVDNAKQVEAAQQLVQQLDSCVASNCAEWPSLLEQGNQLIQELDASEVQAP
ncbi:MULTISPECIES: hypothetical protein [Moorena]|uniref:Uncharacterized protein n=1 Tax=Moorena producens 3L TaxID=489825 RepID=F4XY53_9CYAN|nr:MULTISPECIES: hypothetical protein [Moorena]NEQ15883.1 hypothetical protein [Moorena sp. SIO3E2]NES87706.1 hypothetical protein [Moorena sp. SIO2B7]EGJ30450.1 hypothetical protein LYNGBM3L_50100 [Moorena producens 3L]NEP65893.1 hypothetical protein [Moorena sp. SIO3A5]NER87383.1 hypothetical protein [Moorena sp. SIO3A2]